MENCDGRSFNELEEYDLAKLAYTVYLEVVNNKEKYVPP
jgi:hypothetical protein